MASNTPCRPQSRQTCAPAGRWPHVSRAVVSQLRERYAHVTAVLVTAPKEMLLARLAARGRESGTDMAERIDHAAPAIEALRPDIVIENIGDPHDGASRLAAVLRQGYRI